MAYPGGMDNPVVTMPSPLPADETVDALRTAIANAGFGEVGYHDLNATMAQKGVSLEMPVRILEFCQPHYAKRVIEVEPAISSALPCRISVYTLEGKTWMTTIAPSAMLSMFGAPAAAPIADEVQELVLGIMQEASTAVPA